MLAGCSTEAIMSAVVAVAGLVIVAHPSVNHQNMAN
jgi:hypothetical protein